MKRGGSSPFKTLLVFVALLALAGLPIALEILAPRLSRQIDDAFAALERKERLIRWQLGLPQRGVPDLDRLEARLAERGLAMGAPVLIRIFKKESELELWLQAAGRFQLFATYPICRWSGTIGPKLREGDRQSPEGFYWVSRRQLNPRSRWHRSFNVGFPNPFDRAHGRTGSFIMVHGGCSSVGCYAMTNPVVDEIWRLVTAALARGQKRFQVQLFPFRMTASNMALHRQSPWIAFWRDLKAGHDLFEASHVPPRVSLCNKRYRFRPGALGYDGSAPIGVNDKTCAPHGARAARHSALGPSRHLSTL